MTTRSQKRTKKCGENVGYVFNSFREHEKNNNRNNITLMIRIIHCSKQQCA